MMKPVATSQHHHHHHHHHHEEEEDEDDYEDKGETVKVEGKGSEQKTNTNRSKHSETEQRRRSKINERFQTLRNLIPQNDQKRDKASFLLEVIEYIQFLQEKLQMYEGSHPSWGQEPTKLIPWRNHQGLGESFIDHSQVIKNGSICENNIVIPSMLTTKQSIESDLGNAAVFRTLDHPPGSATSMVNMQTQSNTFSTHGRGNMLPQSFHESASDSENVVYQPQFQSWQSRECITENTIQNSSANEQDDLTIRGETEGFSSAFSQGVLNSLTRALHSSGVDMSQTNISVQIDVGKQVPSKVTSNASSSKEKERQYTSNQVIPQTGVNSYAEVSDQAFKRCRTEKT